MDKLLKQALYSIGTTYLVIRFGQSATSLVANLMNRQATTSSNPLDPDRR